MWPSYSRGGVTLSPCSTQGDGGHCWQIYSQCQCMPCYFIKLIYSTTSARRDAARIWPWCASAQTPWPESLLHLCLTHPLHFPDWFSHQLCQHMAWICITALFTRGLLGDAGGVTLQGDICNLPGLAVNLCAASCSFTCKNLLSSTNNYSKWKRLAGIRLL